MYLVQVSVITYYLGEAVGEDSNWLKCTKLTHHTNGVDTSSGVDEPHD